MNNDPSAEQLIAPRWLLIFSPSRARTAGAVVDFTGLQAQAEEEAARVLVSCHPAYCGSRLHSVRAPGISKDTLPASDVLSLARLRRGNVRARQCNGVQKRALDRLVQKGWAVRFIGAFGESEWMLAVPGDVVANLAVTQ